MSGAMNIKPLSKREEKELEVLEAIINVHQRAFYGVGEALIAIRDGKLYRLQADTFEVYVNEMWGMNESRLYQYINAALVYENLHNCGGFEQEYIPGNEAQCRPLTSLKPEEQCTVWQLVIVAAHSEDTKITAALVSRCVREHLGKEFRKKLDENKEKITPKTVKEQGQNISPKMDESYRGMLKTIESEMQSNWRYTSKEMVRDCLQNLLAAIEEL